MRRNMVLPIIGVIVCIALGLYVMKWVYAKKENNIKEHSMKLTSTAFTHNSSIPSKYTCDGNDISPDLSWEEVPAQAKSLALICDDPDAPKGTWVHWVVFNIPATVTRFEVGTKPAGTEGINSWGANRYGGPCPPSGTHRYYFKLYALDELLDLNADANKEDVERAMKGHILAQAELMGTYSRAK